MPDFKQRYTPQGIGSASYGDLTAHVAATNPHSQYVTLDRFNDIISQLTPNTGGGGNSGSVVEHEAKTNPHPQYVLQSEMTAAFQAHITLEDANGDYLDPHPQYIMQADLASYATKQYVTDAINAIEFPDNPTSVTISLVGKSTGVVPELGDDTVALAGNYGAVLRTMINDHTDPQVQDAQESAKGHLDTDGNALYARRIHGHTAGDVHAAEATHVHDTLYLVPDDITSNRTVRALAWVNGTDYIYTEDVNGTNTIPNIGAATYTDVNMVHPVDNGTITASSNGEAITVNGTTYARSSGDDVTVLSVVGLTNTFAAISHSHTEYLSRSVLTAAGIYPESKKLEDLDESQTFDFDVEIEQGNFYVDTNVFTTIISGPNNAGSGILEVKAATITERNSSTDDDGNITLTTPHESVIKQTFHGEDNRVYVRYISQTETLEDVTYTNVSYAWTANDTTVYTESETCPVGSIVYSDAELANIFGEVDEDAGTMITIGEAIYARNTEADVTTTTTSKEVVEHLSPTSWIDLTNGKKISPTTTSVSTDGQTVTLSAKDGDIHKITLNANASLVITNLGAGQGFEVYVTTTGYNLTFGGVDLLSSVDTGDFVIKFFNYGNGTVCCTGVLSILAQQSLA